MTSDEWKRAAVQLEEERIDEPLLQLMERLRPHFELARAVRFAYQAE